jgi:hypothetical protein
MIITKNKKMRKNNIYYLVLLLLITCGCEKKLVSTITTLPIIISKNEVVTLKNDTISNFLHKGLDTIVAFYNPYISNEARWSNIKNYPSLDLLDDEYFYVEQANDSLVLPYSLYLHKGSIVRFVGQFYKDERLPRNNNENYQLELYEGKVFRYYSYEIILPYYIYPPEKYQDTSIPMDKRVNYFMIISSDGKSIPVYLDIE